MSTKIEYICDGCGDTGSSVKGWIECNISISNGLYKTYHSCRNIICMRKIQQKQCDDVADWAKMQKLTIDPDIDDKQWFVNK